MAAPETALFSIVRRDNLVMGSHQSGFDLRPQKLRPEKFSPRILPFSAPVFGDFSSQPEWTTADCPASLLNQNIPQPPQRVRKTLTFFRRRLLSAFRLFVRKHVEK
jgi:hypothetical protein